MAYTKNTWKTGDIVSSQKLNHMEDGIANAGGVFIGTTESGSVVTLTRTYAEIVNAIQNGVLPFLAIEDTAHPGAYNIKIMVGYGSGEVNGTFSCFVQFADDDYDYSCQTENDYPAHRDSPA